MWKIIACINILYLCNLFSSSVGSDFEENLLNQLKEVISKVNEIIQKISQQQHYQRQLYGGRSSLVSPDNYGNELSMRRALVALNAASNSQERQIDSGNFNLPFEESLNYPRDSNSAEFYRLLPSSRRNNQKVWNNEFYEALTKALKTEIRKRPELQHDLKDDIDSLNILNPNPDD